MESDAFTKHYIIRQLSASELVLPPPPSLPSLMRTLDDPYTLIQLPPYTQGASPLPTSS